MNRTLKHAICILLSVVCLFSFTLVAGAYSDSELISVISDFIISQEGTYDTVNRNDNGALSIGLLGWHATRALDLLKTIVAANEIEAESILGTALYNEIKSSADWEYRTLDPSEATVVAALLGTSQSKAAQDALIAKDVDYYVSAARALGITDGRAIMMYCDIENQCGQAVSRAIAANAAGVAGSYGAVTLDIIYTSALANRIAGSYRARRLACYEYAKSHLNGDSAVAPAESTYKPGTYRVNTEVLNVRSGAGTDNPIVTTVNSGTAVEITEISGEWGKYSAGWIYLPLTVLVSAAQTEEPADQPEEQPSQPGGGTAKNAVYKVTASVLNVRAGAGLNYDIVTTLNRGTTVEVTEISGNWGHISSGWISLDYAELVSPASSGEEETTPATSDEPGTGEYTVTADNLNVRSGPGSENSVLAIISRGTTVRVTEINNGWGKIEYAAGKTGWISLEFITADVSGSGLAGDVNGNGSVDAADARLALRCSANLENLTKAQEKAADVDGNGTVNAADARKILRVSAALE